MEQFDRDGDLTGSAVYLDAYDPFLYVNTDGWEQNMRLLAMLEGDLDCRDGGADVFFKRPGALPPDPLHSLPCGSSGACGV